MSSRTKNWNKKPGDAGFEYGPNKEWRAQRRARHNAIKSRQLNRDRKLGL